MLCQHIKYHVCKNIFEVRNLNLKRLKDLREDKDLYQKQIANVIGTTQQVYSEYELGIRLMPIDKLDKLADFYETSVDYIIGRTNEKAPYKPKKHL